MSSAIAQSKSAEAMNGPAAPEDQAKLLEEALQVVKVQAFQMKKYLEANKFMDGLKHCSDMLAELRTSALTPKNYYELYMSIFDALGHFSTYLREAHNSGRHHLAEHYEFVQYAGNIIPRLYLMITVGSVYMSVAEAPVREIMRDMMEMSRGVQQPTRGLFLRNYLSSMTREYLPIGENVNDGPEGGLQDSITFNLTNFTEMNKLWVRLQHQGHSRDREKREMERRELRILVGTNLVRLSQLEGVDLEMYTRTILPAVLEQVVSCKDVIAQEYLMEVIVQVFPDEFHLRTLQPYLSATAKLHPKVNVKQIIIALVDRLAAYAAREAENEIPEEQRRAEEEAKLAEAKERKRKAKEALRKITETEKDQKKADDEKAENKVEGEEEEKTSQAGTEDGVSDEEKEKKSVNVEVAVEAAAIATAEGVEGVEEEEDQEDQDEQDEELASRPVRRVRGIPEDVQLFTVFWSQIVELVKARPDLSIQDLTALVGSLTNLSLSCYPDRISYVDQVLDYASEKVAQFADSPDLHSPVTTANLLALLLSPIHRYPSVLTLLQLQFYAPLLALQPYSTRRTIAHAVVASVLKAETIISTPEEVNGILSLCDVLVRDQKDAPPLQSLSAGLRVGSRGGRGRTDERNDGPDPEEMAEEQGWLARMVHLMRSDEVDRQFLLLSAARKQFGEGGERIRWTFPPLVVAAMKLARRYKALSETASQIHMACYSLVLPASWPLLIRADGNWEKKATTLFRFIHQLISVLYNKCECSNTCLRLFLLATQSADSSGFEEIAYEFLVQAFTIYEESISESRAQYQAILCIIGTLQQTRVFGFENYDTLITKAALHGSKLLKKPDQARAVYVSSHLWWGTLNGDENGEEGALFRDGKRVLECLQKALKIADSCMDPITNIELFVEILNRYIYYFERRNEAVAVKHLNGLIDLINTNISDLDVPDTLPRGADSSSLIEIDGSLSEYVARHFKTTLLHLQRRRDIAARGDSDLADYSQIEISVGGEL